MRIFGLIGRNINYSFSVAYFSDKFQKKNITDALYKNFDIPDVTYFLQILKKHKDLKGLNVTIPYKQEIIPYLDKLSRKAEEVGAVNTIKITKNGNLKGYNTDVYGFEKSLKPLLKPHHKKALVLGTGGASKAVVYVLEKLGLAYKIVSRNPEKNQLSYADITQQVMQEYTVVINCTPLGTSPNIEQSPELNYNYFTDKHLAFDLIYNPAETTFLRKAKQQGASIQNGHQMLVYQAEKAWQIWNK
jgi:shikimate dehydrogenase